MNNTKNNLLQQFLFFTFATIFLVAITLATNTTASESGNSFSHAVRLPNFFVVNTTSDLPDLTPGDGVCNASLFNDLCSLRAAIMESNASGGADIQLGAGNFILTIGGFAEDNAEEGDLDITADITITGAGEEITIIDGNDLDRIFEVFDNSPENEFTAVISNLTITGGYLAYGQDGSGLMNWGTLYLNQVTLDNNFNLGQGGGGAIWNNGSIFLDDVVVSNNISGGLGGGMSNNGHAEINSSVFHSNTGVAGAGIYNNSGTGELIINETDIVENYGAFLSGGGGILNSRGNMELNYVRLRKNDASTHGGGISVTAADDLTFVANHLIVDRNSSGEKGGGIYIDDFIGMTNVTINYATVSHNLSMQGGGIYLANELGNTSPTIIQNSTISGNVVHFEGAGIYSTGSLDLFDSTIARNRTMSFSPVYSGIGVYFTTSTAATVNLQRTLIAKNKAAPLNPSPDCFIDPSVVFNSLDYNLIGRAGVDCSFTTMPDDQIGSIFLPILAKIGPLQDNGGFSKTHRLYPNSPAIDAAGTGSCGVAYDDQRGVSRPQDGNMSGTFECDIGAFEFKK